MSQISNRRQGVSAESTTIDAAHVELKHSEKDPR